MPTARVKVNGQWYDIGGLSNSERQAILGEANQYASQLFQGMREEIHNLTQAVQDTNSYVDGAFKDGIISEVEAKTIQTYLKNLETKKAEMDREYNDILGNVYLSEESRASLTSAKSFYDEKYNALVDEINNAIADGKASQGEITLVDQGFVDYNNAISLLVSALRSATEQIGEAKANEALTNAMNYADGKIAPIETRLLNAESQITQTAEDIQLRVTRTEMETTMASVKQEAIDEANAYADQLKSQSDSAISNLQAQINDTNTYIDNSFKDGIITSLEASGIANYLNTLGTVKNAFDASYDQLSTNSYLKDPYKTNLQNAKSDLDTAYTNLVNAINAAIADGIATAEEKNDVDTKFQLYNDTVTIYRMRVEQAIDSIAKEKALEAENNANAYTDGQLVPIEQRLTTAESTITQHSNEIAMRVTQEVHDADMAQTLNEAKAYADNLKALTDQSVADLQAQINNTQTYIDGAFKDGIIYEAEYKKIQSYLNTLNESKMQFDNRYNEIYNNTWLMGTPKTDLATAKSNYDEKYNELITTINNAIADQLANATETQAVDTAFTNYNNSVALLVSTLERAIDAISQAKADKAKQDAQTYADQMRADIDGQIQSLQNDINATSEYIDNAFKDGVISETEAKRIATYINVLNESKSVFDQRYSEIYNNTLLSSSYKLDLDMKKQTYDSSYNDLINSINAAIADGVATPAESTDVDIKFSAYNTAARDLTSSIEKAIDNIAQNKANLAQQNAQQYTDSVIAPIDSRLSTAESTITQHADEIALRVTREEFNTAIQNTNNTINQNTAQLASDISQAQARADEAYNYAADLENDIVYKVEIESTNGLIFKNGNINTILNAKVYRGTQDVTDTIDASRFKWTRISDDPVADEAWNSAHSTGTKSITVTSDDVHVRATFRVDILDG
jgi:hypothetical protein